jgi:hypothetical protein
MVSFNWYGDPQSSVSGNSRYKKYEVGYNELRTILLAYCYFPFVAAIRNSSQLITRYFAGNHLSLHMPIPAPAQKVTPRW